LSVATRFLGPKTTAQVAKRSRKQEGVLKVEHAIEAGLTERQIEGLVRSGAWYRPYRRVLIDTGVPVTPMQPIIAASFAMGAGALGSHRLSGWMWELIRSSAPPVLEFSVPVGRHPRPPGITVHRVTTMPPAARRGLVAVTSPLRALVDIGGVAPDYVPEALLNGLIAKLFTPNAVARELERAAVQGKPGVSVLRAALLDLGIGRYTPSQLEARARKLFRDAGLPPPQVEVVFGDHNEYRLDFYWPEADLVIEVDGWSIHAAPGARRTDFRKQNRVVIGDHWILRYDWFQIVYEQELTAAEIIEAYRARTALL
jgi:hypothetical protein